MSYVKNSFVRTSKPCIKSDDYYQQSSRIFTITSESLSPISSLKLVDLTKYDICLSRKTQLRQRCQLKKISAEKTKAKLRVYTGNNHLKFCHSGVYLSTKRKLLSLKYRRVQLAFQDRQSHQVTSSKPNIHLYTEVSRCDTSEATQNNTSLKKSEQINSFQRTNVCSHFKIQTSSIAQTFAGETTAHGYKRIIASHRSTAGKFLWLLAIFCVASITVSKLLTFLLEEEFYSFSTISRSQANTTIVFPAVTLCNLMPYDSSRVSDAFLRNHSDIMHLLSFEVSTPENLKLPANATFKHFTTKDLEQMIGWTVSSFIRKCYWNDAPVSCSDIFVRSRTASDSCFSFNANSNNAKFVEKVGSFSGLTVILNVGASKGVFGIRKAAGVKVLLHDQEQYPDTREKGLLVSPSTITYLRISRKEYKFLAKPYWDDCFDVAAPGRDDELEWTSTGHYNYSGPGGCWAECRLRYIINRCGCVAYAGDPEIPGVPFCSIESFVSCYIPTLRQTYILPQFNQSLCSCRLPCQMVEYTGHISAATIPRCIDNVTCLRYNQTNEPEIESLWDLIQLKIFYENLVTQVEEHVPKYSWSTAVEDIGGKMGLLTGASVLTILEFMELGMLMIWVVCQMSYKHITRRSNNPEAENVP